MRSGRTITLLALASASLAGCNQKAEAEKIALPAPPPPKTRPMQVEEPVGAAIGAAASGPVIRLTGTTAPHRESQVAATGTGLVESLRVREGDYIEAGQLIARLDRRQVRLHIRQAEIGVRAARVQLAAAEREKRRMEDLVKQKAVPQSQLDQILTGYDAAEVGVEGAKVGLAMARKAEEDADVHAPFAGLVTRRLKAEGEWVSTMPPSPLIVLAEVDPLDLRIDAPEHLLTTVKAGDRLVVRFAALDRTVEATVTRVIPLVDGMARTFSVIAELPNPDRSLQPGVFAEVEIRPRAEAAP